MKDQYIHEVERLLPLPRQAKKEVLRDLEEAFASAAEHGETESQLIQRLGSPKEFVESLNEQLGFERLSGEIWKRKQIIAIVCAAILSLLCLGVYSAAKAMGMSRMIESLGVIGGADGPTAIFVTSTGPDILYWMALLGIVSFGAGVVLAIRYIRRKHKDGKKDQ